MQGDRKEQHSSHSLKPMEGKIWSLTQTCRNDNREWTPQIERHPLTKNPRSLRTWFGPSPERGPGTQPTKNSKWISVRTMYSIKFQFVYVTYSNATIREDKSMVRTMAQCYQSNQGECSYRQGSGPMIFVYIMWPHWKETISHFCDTLKIWNSGRNQRNQLSVLWNFSYPKPYPVYPETSLTLGTPR